MKKILILSALFALTLVASAQQRMHMSFSDTSIGVVLKAIATRTATNVVYVGAKEGAGIKVTLDVNVGSAEEAVRAAVSAAGLAYRKVDGTYIVAAPEQMRRALEPYSMKVRYTMAGPIAEKIAPKVQQTYPDATVQALGDRLVFVGLPEDIRESKTLIEDLRRYEVENAPVNEIVSIANATPADVSKVIGELWPSLKVNAAGDDKGGAITISGPAKDVSLAKEFAAKVDSAMTSGPEANAFRVYEIKYASAPKLLSFMKEAAKDVEAFIAPETYSPPRGVFNPLVSAIQNSGAASGTTQNQTLNQNQQSQGSQLGTDKEDDKNRRSRRLVLRGAPDRLDAVMNLLAKVDVKPQQVIVEVNVVETSPSLTDNTGFNWSWSPFQFHEVPPGTAIDTIPSETRPVGVGQFSRVPFSFGSILNAQIKKGEAKVLANPKVQVVDNDSASIFIGDTIRAKVVQVGPLGAQTVQIEEFPVGIILLINPRVNADGNITMHVNPVVSTVTDIGSDNIPQTSSREAETTVIVKDGETIVLGGLIRDEYSKVVTEVPFLSKLPIIGELFRNRSTTKRRTDVIVTITPHLIKD